MKPKDALGLKFYCGDLREELTVKQYLKKLLTTVWMEADGFSGKRPFGNSGWTYDIYACLIKNGAIDGKLDDCGYVDDVDEYEADQYVAQIIDAI
jgi:hypothetical protein